MIDALILVRTSDTKEKRSVDLHLHYGDSELIDWNSYSLSFSELKKSTQKSGDFFIITCDCGFPECAEIYSPIKVEHNGDQVR